MRIPVIATIGAFVAITAIAAPMLPDDAVSDQVYAPAGEAVPKLAQASIDMTKNVLSVAKLADPAPRQPIDFDNLIRIDGQDYEVSYSENFSGDVQSLQTVRKIGYGQSREISIMTTPSGTYSTDGLVSPNVRYPDIETRRAMARSEGGYRGSVWHRGLGWLPQNFSPAHSIITFGRLKDGGRFISGKGHTCFRGQHYATCN